MNRWSTKVLGFLAAASLLAQLFAYTPGIAQTLQTDAASKIVVEEVLPDIDPPHLSDPLEEEAEKRNALAFDGALARVPVDNFAEAAPGTVVTCSLGQREHERVTDPGLLSLGLAELKLEPDESVLVIGDASGFVTAVLASLHAVYPKLAVVIVEADPLFRESAKRAVEKTGLSATTISDKMPIKSEVREWDVIVLTEPQAILPVQMLQTLPKRGRLLLPLRPGNTGRPNLVLVSKLDQDVLTKNLGPATLRTWCREP